MKTLLRNSPMLWNWPPTNIPDQQKSVAFRKSQNNAKSLHPTVQPLPASPDPGFNLSTPCLPAVAPASTCPAPACSSQACQGPTFPAPTCPVSSQNLFLHTVSKNKQILRIEPVTAEANASVYVRLLLNMSMAQKPDIYCNCDRPAFIRICRLVLGQCACSLTQ